MDVPAGQIGRRRNPRHGSHDPAGPGEDAGQKVGVVAIGHSHHHVRPLDIGLLQHAWICPISMHGHEIQMGIQFGKHLCRGVDHDHVMFVLAKLLGQMGAGLAAAYDQYTHESIRFSQLSIHYPNPPPPCKGEPPGRARCVRARIFDWKRCLC